MRQLSIILLLLFISATVLGQQMKMRIHLNDGSNEFYPIDDIDSITFVHHSSDSTYDMVRVFSNFVLHTDGTYESEFPGAGKTIYGDPRGRITFSGDTLDIPWRYDFERYPLVSSYPGLHFDSISFVQYSTNADIARLQDSAVGEIITPCRWYSRNASYQCMTWHDSVINYMAAENIGSLTVDENSRVIGDTAFCPFHYSGKWLERATDADRFLTIRSRFDDPIIQSGILTEYAGNIGDKQLLATIDSNISRGIYYKSGGIIYYSYGPSFNGTTLAPDAGFYFYEPSTDSVAFLLPFASELGTDEGVNGFDISPDKTTLLIHVCTKTKVPFLIEYNFLTKQKDTLLFNEFNNFKSKGLWLQYSHDGKSILYNFFTSDLYRLPYFAASNAGIIDRASHTVTKLELSPDNQTPWVSMFPRWSPSDDRIGYVSCRYDPQPPVLDFTFWGDIFVLKLH